MAEYMNKELFLSSMGLRGDETKYGNRDGEHQHRSYSTYMSYEIMDCVEDSIEEDVAPVVRCKDCKHLSVWNRPDLYAHCPKTNTVFIPFEIDTRTHFCSYGDRKTEEENK